MKRIPPDFVNVGNVEKNLASMLSTFSPTIFSIFANDHLFRYIYMTYFFDTSTLFTTRVALADESEGIKSY